MLYVLFYGFYLVPVFALVINFLQFSLVVEIRVLMLLALVVILTMKSLYMSFVIAKMFMIFGIPLLWRINSSNSSALISMIGFVGI